MAGRWAIPDGWSDCIAVPSRHRHGLARPAGPFVLLDDARPGKHALILTEPSKTFVAHRTDEVVQVLEAACAAAATGRHVAGYIAYEAGFALDPRLAALAGEPLLETPLLWFAAFDQAIPVGEVGAWLPEPSPLGPVGLDWDFRRYQQAFDRTTAYIEQGDVYQINLTMPAWAATTAAPLRHYADLRLRQRAGWGGVVFDGASWLLSCSPELFFTRRGREVVCKPMKGTAPRGPDRRADRRNAQWLAASVKDRAENLMIVDLLRNDLSKVCQPGSVTVPALWTVEPYPTLFQLTSTVTGTLRETVDCASLLSALFPCGSITGAPKLRAMEIIAELEGRGRGPYTGAMGILTPGNDAFFNILIRTLRIEDGASVARTDVGSGIVFDSVADSEWRECRTKMRYLAGDGARAAMATA